MPPVKQGERSKFFRLKTPAENEASCPLYRSHTSYGMENPAKHVENKELREILKTTSGLGTPATGPILLKSFFASFIWSEKGRKSCRPPKGFS